MRTKKSQKTILLLTALIWVSAANLFAQNVGDKFQHTDGLYYRVTSLDPATVEVAPQLDEAPYWNEDDEPTGALTFPEQVTHGDVTYNVTAIGQVAFAGCNELTQVNFPNGLLSVGSWAFDGSGLTEVILPNSVTTLKMSCFQSCSALTLVILPSSITTIEGFAFAECNTLRDVTCLVPNPNNITVGAPYAFGIPFAGATLYVPQGSVSAYENSSPWNNFGWIGEANLTTTPQAHNFDVVTIGETASKSIILTNGDTQTITITSFNMNRTEGGIFTHNAIAGITLAHGVSYKFTVFFNPMEEGPVNATLSIANTGTVPTVEVALSGYGEPTICNSVENLTGNADNHTVTLTWNSPAVNGDGNQVLLHEDFENGIPDTWSTIDDDGDGYAWVYKSGFLGYNGSHCISSASYINGIGVLTPDNYLITPPVENATQITYWVNAQDEDWAAEHYAVMASTTGTNVDDFEIVFEETLTAKNSNEKQSSTERGNSKAQGTWYNRTVQLPQGTKYIAFRHYNCTNQYYLNIDEVTISQSYSSADYTYNIYKDDALLAEAVTATTYVDEAVEVGNYNYCVEAVLLNCTAAQVCTQVEVIGLPVIAITPTSHNFGTVEIGQSATQTFTITNTGTAWSLYYCSHWRKLCF